MRRWTASPNASSAPIGSLRSSPRSSAKWLRVPAGTQTNGILASIAMSATSARLPSPPAMPRRRRRPRPARASAARSSSGPSSTTSIPRSPASSASLGPCCRSVAGAWVDDQHGRGAPGRTSRRPAGPPPDRATPASTPATASTSDRHQHERELACRARGGDRSRRSRAAPALQLRSAATAARQGRPRGPHPNAPAASGSEQLGHPPHDREQQRHDRRRSSSSEATQPLDGADRDRLRTGPIGRACRPRRRDHLELICDVRHSVRDLLDRLVGHRRGQPGPATLPRTGAEGSRCDGSAGYRTRARRLGVRQPGPQHLPSGRGDPDADARRGASARLSLVG